VFEGKNVSKEVIGISQRAFAAGLIAVLLASVLLSYAISSTVIQTGPQGPKGDKGDPGSQGETGPQGEQGLTGGSMALFGGTSTTATVKNLKYVGTDKNDLNATVPANKTWVVVCIRIYCLRTSGQESLVELTLMDETGEQFYCGWGQILTGSVGGVLAQSMFAYSGAGTPIVGFQHGYQVSGGNYSYLGCTDCVSLPTPCYLEGGAMIRMRDSKGNAQYLKYWLRVLESDA